MSVVILAVAEPACGGEKFVVVVVAVVVVLPSAVTHAASFQVFEDISLEAGIR